MTAYRYARRPNLVDAMQVTEADAVEIADWADGHIDRDPQTGKLQIRLPQSKIPATIGDWVVRDHMPDGLGPARPMLANVFTWAFQLAE
ncbi:hypothetical protein [Dactylosporangium sp. CA-139066]|uniref:hypothetical protein n=1 Tax=Dactylosporangium sp. CA-139066 TaxID=3239930 RepID=UPI003D92BC2B